MLPRLDLGVAFRIAGLLITVILQGVQLGCSDGPTSTTTSASANDDSLASENSVRDEISRLATQLIKMDDEDPDGTSSQIWRGVELPRRRQIELEEHLASIADRDKSGTVAPSELEWLRSTILATWSAGIAAREVGTDPAVLASALDLTESELRKVLDDFYQIEGELRLQCAVSFPPNPRIVGLDSIETLPSHWQHIQEQGIDTATGCFYSAQLDLSVIYDVGEPAGAIVQECSSGGPHWLRIGLFRGVEFRSLLDEDTLLITFPSEGPANYAVRLDDPAQADYVLELVLEYRQQLHRLKFSHGPGRESPCEL